MPRPRRNDRRSYHGLGRSAPPGVRRSAMDHAQSLDSALHGDGNRLQDMLEAEANRHRREQASAQRDRHRHLLESATHHTTRARLWQQRALVVSEIKWIAIPVVVIVGYGMGPGIGCAAGLLGARLFCDWRVSVHMGLRDKVLRDAGLSLDYPS